MLLINVLFDNFLAVPADDRLCFACMVLSLRTVSSSCNSSMKKCFTINYYFYKTSLFLDNTYEVNLVKGTSGLGFSICGGKDASPEPARQAVRLKKVFPHGPAALNTDMQVGDVILEVNGRKLKDLSHNVSAWPCHNCGIF